MDSVIHDFAERLEYSAELSDEPSWVEFYRRLWPNMISCVRIDKNSRWQKWGVDRMVLLGDGKQFTIDEKKREKDYGDLLLEEWSVADVDKSGRLKGHKIGWSLDESKQSDFIAYSVPIAGRCYLLPFELTRLTFAANINEWKRLMGARYPLKAHNKGYTTINVSVSWDRFRHALGIQMHRRFGAEIPLPLPKPDTNQLTFEWGRAS